MCSYWPKCSMPQWNKYIFIICKEYSKRRRSLFIVLYNEACRKPTLHNRVSSPISRCLICNVLAMYNEGLFSMNHTESVVYGITRLSPLGALNPFPRAGMLISLNAYYYVGLTSACANGSILGGCMLDHTYTWYKKLQASGTC